MAPINALASLRIVKQSLVPVRHAKISRTRGRTVQSEEDAVFHWKCSFELPALSRAGDAASLRMLMKIGPGGSTFLCHDTFRPRPVLEDNGSPLADGLGVIDAITDSLNVTISGLPSGFQLSAGDYIEFRENVDTRLLNIIDEDVTASGAGVADIVLTYPLDTENFTTSGIVNFEKPSCIMQRTEMFDRSTDPVMAEYSFNAEEVFYG